MIDIKVQPCPVCGAASDPKFLFDKASDDRGNDNISLYRCASCKTVYLAKYNESYDDDLYAYYQKYQGMEKEELYNPQTRKSYIKVLELLSSYGSVVSILDVGCGRGDFVDAALNGGYKAEGIELAQPAVDIACGYGLPVTKLDFFSSEIKESSRDVVTMFEIIEHLPDPIAFLRRAEMVVKPGGLVYMTTPNFNSLDRRILGSKWQAIHREHLTYFTPSTLLAAIQSNTTLELLHKETRNISEALINHVKEQIKKVSFRNRVGQAHNTNPRSKPFDLRNKIETTSSLLLLKRAANSFLNITSLGATIVMILRRPE